VAVDFADKIEALVQEIEAQSSAEVVVSLHDSSANYRDLDLLWVGFSSLMTLAYKVWSPQSFHPDWLLPNLMLVGLLTYFASRRFQSMRRLFLSARRRAQELERTAYSEFVRLGIGRTRERTGLLIFASRLERAIVLVPDQGLEEKIAPPVWSEWADRYGTAESDQGLLQNLEQQLQALKAPLGRQLPRREDDTNELPDRPVEVS